MNTHTHKVLMKTRRSVSKRFVNRRTYRNLGAVQSQFCMMNARAITQDLIAAGLIPKNTHSPTVDLLLTEGGVVEMSRVDELLPVTEVAGVNYLRKQLQLRRHMLEVLGEYVLETFGDFLHQRDTIPAVSQRKAVRELRRMEPQFNEPMLCNLVQNKRIEVNGWCFEVKTLFTAKKVHPWTFAHWINEILSKYPLISDDELALRTQQDLGTMLSPGTIGNHRQTLGIHGSQKRSWLLRVLE